MPEEDSLNRQPLSQNSAREFDFISSAIFAPIYPVIARQAIALCQKSTGICIDLGSGPGFLGIEVARQTHCRVFSLDISVQTNRTTGKNILQAGLEDRVTAFTADVHCLPLKDRSVDLIVSRGSIFFWDNLELAFREIRRVLKPGGMAYIGTGFGKPELKEAITREMETRYPGWKHKLRKRLGPESREKIVNALISSGIETFNVIDDDSGLWFCFGKPGR